MRLLFVVCLLALGGLTACGAQATPLAPTAPPATATAALSAPTAPPKSAATSAPSAAAYSDNDVTHAVVFDLMEARLKLGLSAWQSGNYELSKKYANPNGLFNYVAPALNAQNADAPLKAALDAVAPLLEKAGDEAKVKDANKAVLDAINSGRQAIVGAQLTNPKFLAEIISRLMTWTADTYARNAGATGIGLLYAYQRAFGYLDMAKSRYKVIAANAQDSSGLNAQFAALDALFPDATEPPAALSDGQKVAAATAAIQTGLQKSFGLSAQANSPSQFLDNARRGVQAAVDLYKAGKNKDAYEALVDAYLNGFEFIEAPLDAKDKNFRQTLEGKFRDMREAVKANKPVADVETLAKDISQDLATASDLLAGKVVVTSPSFTDDDVAQIAALGKIRGHLLASLPLWDAGKYDLAAKHAGHPVEELFTIVEKPLKAKNADTALKPALDAYTALASKAGDAAAIRSAHKAALDAAQAASRALVGAALADPKFNGQAIRALLESVEEEYKEAIESGKIKQAIEYQDSMGFFTVAAELYAANLEAKLKADKPAQHKTVTEQFALLKANYPDFVKMTDKPLAPDDVEKALDTISNALTEALGLPKETGSVDKSLKTARENVTAALAKYKEGKGDDAYELAVKSYLDGFEKLEGELVNKDKALMQSLEVQFKNFRDAIKAKKPLAEVEAIAKTINAGLDKTEQLLK